MVYWRQPTPKLNSHKEADKCVAAHALNSGQSTSDQRARLGMGYQVRPAELATPQVDMGRGQTDRAALVMLSDPSNGASPGTRPPTLRLNGWPAARASYSRSANIKTVQALNYATIVRFPTLPLPTGNSVPSITAR